MPSFSGKPLGFFPVDIVALDDAGSVLNFIEVGRAFIVWRLKSHWEPC